MQRSLLFILLLACLVIVVVNSHQHETHSHHRSHESHQNGKHDHDSSLFRKMDHEEPTLSWRQFATADWNPEHTVQWLRFKLSKYVPNKSPTTQDVLEKQMQTVLEKFRTYALSGASLLHARSQMNKIISDIEDMGLREYLKDEYHHLVNMNPGHHDKSTGFSIMSLITIPFQVIRYLAWGLLRMFEITGLLFLYTAWISPTTSEKSLLNSASLLFQQSLNSFFATLDTKIRVLRQQAKRKSGLALILFKILVLGPASVFGAPVFFTSSLFFIVVRTILNKIRHCMPGIVVVAFTYLISPSWLWSAVSFVLLRLGDYGMILFLYRAFNLLYEFVLRQYESTKRQLVEMNNQTLNEVPESQPSKDTTTTAVQSDVLSEQVQPTQSPVQSSQEVQKDGPQAIAANEAMKSTTTDQPVVSKISDLNKLEDRNKRAFVTERQIGSAHGS